MEYDITCRTVSLDHPSGHSTAWHTHVVGQLCRVDAGLLIVDTGIGRWVVPPGWLGWIPPAVGHAAWSQSAVRGLSLYLDSRWSEGLPDQPMVMAEDPLRDAVFRRLADRDAATEPSRVNHLLAVLHDELVLARTQPQPLRLPMPRDPRLRRMATALLEAPGDELSARLWAERVGIGERTLSRRFVQETGMNFVHWRQLARLQQALVWLGEGKSVGWVAQSCAYASTSAFIRMYQRYLGRTPGQSGKP